ncbi:MAG TPA: glycoside hydrolase family 31 protein [Actinophytocola sp.]|uniref:glycoside hydrolase family 31 protein n=1 Tax=Actinophytocola sp. TaxID=1872138 RepID=UPI002DDD4A02|nr:glycoside hydrolase family 31 protein [Actinophytocola sp.]HEV2783935.1 glycoside hydrolase family 31 protein [Actinophytocola sp.]
MSPAPRPALARRVRRWQVIAAVVAVLVAGVPPAAAGQDVAPARPGALRWTAEPAPFRLTFHAGDRPLVGQAAGDFAGPGGRMAYALADGTTHRLTDLRRTEPGRDGTTYVVATSEPDRTALVRVARTARGLRVEWRLAPAAGVTQVYEALTGDDTEHFLGGGANFIYTDLRHRVLLNKAHFTGAGPLPSCNKSGMPSPFFLSSHGYAVFPDTAVIGRIAFPNAVDDPPHCSTEPPPCPVLLGRPDRTQLCFKASRLDYEIYAGSPATVVRAYSTRAGLPTLPPVRQFALTHWRDTVDGQATVVDDVDQLLRRGIPLATEWIDNPWETSTKLPEESQNSRFACNGTLTFDPVQFPDPAKLVADLRARGVALGIWISPHVRTIAAERPCPAHDYPPGSFIRTSRTDPLQLDLTNPAARAHFQSKLERLFSLGITMVKGDRGEEFELEDATFFGGTGVDLMNTNPVRYAQATVEVLRKLYGDSYTTLWRGGYTGQPAIVNGVWGGDPRATFEGLRLSVRRGLNSWLSGHPVWGTDTGGFNGGGPGAPSAALLTRWSQFSVVSPVFEVGGAGRNATPWLYDEATVARFRANVLLHYALFPYLYGLAQRAARLGDPIVRPLAFDHPADESAWTADQHMLIGSDLLAVPATADRNESDAAAGQPTPVDVYLPAGTWTDLYTGEVLSGPRHLVRPSTLDDFPLYLRGGAAIGFNHRIDGVWPTPWNLNDLDRRDRSGWLYAPAPGLTTATSPTGGTFFAHTANGTTTLLVANAPTETQLTIATPTRPRHVLIDGHPTPETTGPLTNARTGWTTRPAPFGGILVKLAPRSGLSTVTLTLG